MVRDVTDRERAAVAVPDHDRIGEGARREPRGGDAVVVDRLGVGLERGAFCGAAVADAEDVVPAAVESEAGETHARERRRQEARRALIEVHRVAVEEQRRAGGGPFRLVPGAVERHGSGRDRNERRLHRV